MVVLDNIGDSYSQFTIHHSPFTIHHSPFTIHNFRLLSASMLSQSVLRFGHPINQKLNYAPAARTA